MRRALHLPLPPPDAEPKEVLSGEHPETAALIAARDEVRTALEAARRVAPKLSGEVALISFASPCQVHPLVAQVWTGRLRDRIVLAANTGFRAGWIHFAARSAADIDLIAFLAAHAPPGADELYGNGHRRATGGALRPPDWNTFVRELGFGAEMEMPA
jgi:single-stranded-DNA-specific exonuclease